MVQRYYPHAHLVQIAPGIKTGVRLSIDNPREAGPDRIANTHAAFHLYGGPCITVDFGTSTNIDVISEHGDFLGGAFAPGIEISIDALASRAANLLKIPLVKPRSVIGKNTVECLQSGMVYGTAAQVDGLVRTRVSSMSKETRIDRPRSPSLTARSTRSRSARRPSGRSCRRRREPGRWRASWGCRGLS